MRLHQNSAARSAWRSPPISRSQWNGRNDAPKPSVKFQPPQLTTPLRESSSRNAVSVMSLAQKTANGL